MIQIGLFADLHYARGVREGTRFCHLGIERLHAAVRAFGAADVDLIVGLGDLVDSGETVEEEAGYLREVRDVLVASGRPVRLVPGNHCVSGLTKAEYLGITGQTSTWGSMDLGPWRLLFLDGCFRADGAAYGARNSDWKDAWISAEQVAWLRGELIRDAHPTLVFVHQRLDVEPPYGVGNAAEIREMLEKSGRVKGVFQGHEHAGAFSEINGIRYTTLPAMVEGNSMEQQAFAILQADDGGGCRLVSGRANEVSR